jgi:hypothetical protein
VVGAASAKLRRVGRRARQELQIARLGCSNRRLTAPHRVPEVVVSLTSHPARIEHAWIAIETVFRQTLVPDRIVLVLAEDAFSSRALPRRIVRQQRRGLEIVWVDRDGGSFDKLVPTRLAYPDAAIITVDDDAMYMPTLVARLTAHAERHPGTVVGTRGWEIEHGVRGPVRYNAWPRATRDTPSERLFLTGVGGILYPPDALPIPLLTDRDLATSLCPTNDDIWFWAVARAAGVPSECLGLSARRAILRQARTPRLEAVNRGEGQFDVQFARVLEYFGTDTNVRPRLD